MEQADRSSAKAPGIFLPTIKPRWSLAFSVVVVHFAFAITALVVVLTFSDVILEIEAEDAVASRFRSTSSVRWDVFINCCLLGLFGIQHFLAFPVINVRETKNQDVPEPLVDFDSWIILEAKRSRYVVCLCSFFALLFGINDRIIAGRSDAGHVVSDLAMAASALCDLGLS
jgi:hypothetical protein